MLYKKQHRRLSTDVHRNINRHWLINLCLYFCPHISHAPSNSFEWAFLWSHAGIRIAYVYDLYHNWNAIAKLWCYTIPIWSLLKSSSSLKLCYQTKHHLFLHTSIHCGLENVIRINWGREKLYGQHFHLFMENVISYLKSHRTYWNLFTVILFSIHQHWPK